METSIFREHPYVLAIKESELRYDFNKSGYLRYVSISSNKVIEFRKNNLLEQKKLKAYTAIGIVHDKKIIKIPIVRGSWRYGGQKQSVLKVSVSPQLRLKKGELHNWHLQLFEHKSIEKQ